MPADEVERRLAAILSADVAGYSRLMASDQEGTVSRLATYRDEIALLVDRHGGRLVDFTGDNFLAEFPSARAGVECAQETQAVLAGHNSSLTADRKMEFRMGIHLGDVQVEGERIFGTGVNIAARLEALAEAGGVCISGAVHEQVESTSELRFEDLGEQSVKNIPRPVQTYRVRGVASSATTASETGATDRPSIVVLPFANMSSDPEQEYFCDGMAEEVINALTQLENLHVVARTSAFSFKGRDVDVREIGNTLGVRSVLEGSVRKAGDRLRVTAQLINVDDGYHLWSDRFDRKLDDVFAVQDEIASNIVDALKVEMAVGPSPADRVRPRRNQEAYDLYLIACASFNAMTEAGLDECLALLERAIALDPEYSPAHTRKAVALHFTAFGAGQARRRLEAREAIQRAIELDPEDGIARSLLGEISCFLLDWETAERNGRRALELEPSGVGPHAHIIWLLAATGRTAEAVEEISIAHKLDPLQPVYNRNYGHMLYADRRYESAVQQLRTALAMHPTLTYTSLLLFETLWSMGERAAAILQLQKTYQRGSGAEAETIRRLSSESGPEAVLHWWADHLEAEAIDADVLVLLGESSPFVKAIVHALLGEADAALSILEPLANQHADVLVWRIANPSFDNIREEPRFKDILRRLGLEAYCETLRRRPSH